jgi:hypothetical protein
VAMKPGQLAQLQDLNKCWNMPRAEMMFVAGCLFSGSVLYGKHGKAQLRRLTHQYRNQIAAVKRNQGRA